MKTVMKLVLSALLAFALVSPAAAYFEPGNLVMVAYDTTYNGSGNKAEVAVDLGIDVAGYDFSQQNVELVAPGTFDFTTMNLEKSSISYFAQDVLTPYFATRSQQPAYNPNGRISMFNGTPKVYDNFATSGSNIYVGNIDNLNGFRRNIDGDYTALLYDTTEGQGPLANITTDGYVDMYLQYGDATQANLVAALRLNGDGSVVLNAGAPAVPVPAAVWMLASGLVGLVGVRRKKQLVSTI